MLNIGLSYCFTKSERRIIFGQNFVGILGAYVLKLSTVCVCCWQVEIEGWIECFSCEVMSLCFMCIDAVFPLLAVILLSSFPLSDGCVFSLFYLVMHSKPKSSPQ